MARIMVYPLHNTVGWWRYVTAHLNFAHEVTLVSDLKEADVCIMSAFYKALKDPSIERVALEEVGGDGCAEIIARCRFLRTLKADLALRMIGAMWRVLDDVVERHAPDVLLSCVVDRYSLDVFERVLRRRGVRYVGLAISPLPDHVMFMAKGEYLPVREPTVDEIDDAIATVIEPGFLPAYLQKRSFTGIRFLQVYAHFTLRWLAFEWLQLWENNPLEHRYRSTRNPACGFRARLRDWRVMRQVDERWRDTFDATPPERRIFLGLQVTPEAAIDQWVQNVSLIQDEVVFERVAEVLSSAGYRVFVKDHPSQFGFRRIEHVRRLVAIPSVTFVPYDVPGRVLIDQCHATVTLTGTVGFQAALAGRSAVVAHGTYYATGSDHFILLRDATDIERLPDTLAAFSPPGDLVATRRAIMAHLLRASVPGKLTWLKWTPESTNVSTVTPLIASLNRYGPMFLPDGALRLSSQQAAAESEWCA